MATVRRVRRVIRKVDPWTVFKVSSVLSAVGALAIVLGEVMFWSVVTRAGIPGKLTNFLVEITLLEEGSDPFGDSEQFLRLAIFGAIVWAIFITGASTLTAVMYNLVSDVVGGIELVVLEETLHTQTGGVLAPTRQAAARPAPPPPPAPRSDDPIVDLPTEETPISSTS